MRAEKMWLSYSELYVKVQMSCRGEYIRNAFSYLYIIYNSSLSFELTNKK